MLDPQHSMVPAEFSPVTIRSPDVSPGVRAVQITQLFVPEEVRNGTTEAAVLDCQYSLAPADLSVTSGLVVKWFFNNGPAPVYQWIPGQKPQVNISCKRYP